MWGHVLFVHLSLPLILSKIFGLILQGLSMTRMKYTGIPSSRKTRAIRGGSGALDRGTKSRNTQKHVRQAATGAINQS